LSSLIILYDKFLSMHKYNIFLLFEIMFVFFPDKLFEWIDDFTISLTLDPMTSKIMKILHLEF